MGNLFSPMKRFSVCFLTAVTLLSFCRAEEESDDFEKEWKAKTVPLLEQWRKAENKSDPNLKEDLIQAAVYAGQSEIVEEIMLDGDDVSSKEIKLPSEEQKIPIHIIQSFEELSPYPNNGWLTRDPFNIRRMTKGSFEIWSSKHGWLFDAKGKLLNEAFPPRRDGVGREWFGAFLPDGRWVTTDLWELDKTLTFFSKAGKWIKEINGKDLYPANPDSSCELNLIAWARCDKEGKGWVVSIGEYPGNAHVFVRPNGKAQLLEYTNQPWDKLWKLCYPRDLEPKGHRQALTYSDDLKRLIQVGRPGHGPMIEYPSFSWGDKDILTNHKVVPFGGNFGFLPNSHDVFIEGSKTWFFDEHGKCRAWIGASYLADSSEAKETWYVDPDQIVVTLGSDLKPHSRIRFVIDETNANPVKLFTDLRIGFFLIDQNLVLARW